MRSVSIRSAKAPDITRRCGSSGSHSSGRQALKSGFSVSTAASVTFPSIKIADFGRGASYGNSQPHLRICFNARPRDQRSFAHGGSQLRSKAAQEHGGIHRSVYVGQRASPIVLLRATEIAVDFFLSIVGCLSACALLACAFLYLFSPDSAR